MSGRPSTVAGGCVGLSQYEEAARGLADDWGTGGVYEEEHRIESKHRPPGVGAMLLPLSS